MRLGISLMLVAGFFIAAAWNTTAIFNAYVHLYQSDQARSAFTMMAGLTGVAVAVLALFVIGRHAMRQIDRDFDQQTKHLKR